VFSWFKKKINVEQQQNTLNKQPQTKKDLNEEVLDINVNFNSKNFFKKIISEETQKDLIISIIIFLSAFLVLHFDLNKNYFQLIFYLLEILNIVIIIFILIKSINYGQFNKNIFLSNLQERFLGEFSILGSIFIAIILDSKILLLCLFLWWMFFSVIDSKKEKRAFFSLGLLCSMILFYFLKNYFAFLLMIIFFAIFFFFFVYKNTDSLTI
jgi:hypothetical protein